MQGKEYQLDALKARILVLDAENVRLLAENVRLKKTVLIHPQGRDLLESSAYHLVSGEGSLTTGGGSGESGPPSSSDEIEVAAHGGNGGSGTPSSSDHGVGNRDGWSEAQNLGHTLNTRYIWTLLLLLCPFKLLTVVYISSVHIYGVSTKEHNASGEGLDLIAVVSSCIGVLGDLLFGLFILWNPNLPTLEILEVGWNRCRLFWLWFCDTFLIVTIHAFVLLAHTGGLPGCEMTTCFFLHCDRYQGALELFESLYLVFTLATWSVVVRYIYILHHTTVHVHREHGKCCSYCCCNSRECSRRELMVIPRDLEIEVTIHSSAAEQMPEFGRRDFNTATSRHKEEYEGKEKESSGREDLLRQPRLSPGTGHRLLPRGTDIFASPPTRASSSLDQI